MYEFCLKIFLTVVSYKMLKLEGVYIPFEILPSKKSCFIRSSTRPLSFYSSIQNLEDKTLIYIGRVIARIIPRTLQDKRSANVCDTIAFDYRITPLGRLERFLLVTSLIYVSGSQYLFVRSDHSTIPLSSIRSEISSIIDLMYLGVI